MLVCPQSHLTSPIGCFDTGGCDFREILRCVCVSPNWEFAELYWMSLCLNLGMTFRWFSLGSTRHPRVFIPPNALFGSRGCWGEVV